jgi:hypothetical protein
MLRAFASLLLCAPLLACGMTTDGGDGPMAVDGGSTPVADFSLTDVNPTSPRTGTPVSPRDYIGRVTAWYFGHAT